MAMAAPGGTPANAMQLPGTERPHAAEAAASAEDAAGARLKDWERAPKMLSKRKAHGVCSIGAKLFVIGGWDGHQVHNSIEMLDVSTLVNHGKETARTNERPLCN